MAGGHPERVDRLVYLDAAYDWEDPGFVTAFKAIPSVFTPPVSSMTSLDAWRAYQRTVAFSALRDLRPAEAYIRELVIVQPDGTVRPRMSDTAAQALGNTLFTYRKDYTKVHSPALAIYAETGENDARYYQDPALRADVLAWEQKYNVASFRSASIERARRELSNVEIVNVLGTHINFVFTSRQQVVAAMRRFLSASALQK